MKTLLTSRGVGVVAWPYRVFLVATSFERDLKLQAVGANEVESGGQLPGRPKLRPTATVNRLVQQD